MRHGYSNPGPVQAIIVKYNPPTNHRGSGVTAKAQAGSIRVAWDYEIDDYSNCWMAAMALAKKVGWDANPSSWRGGRLPDGSCAFVFAD